MKRLLTILFAICALFLTKETIAASTETVNTQQIISTQTNIPSNKVVILNMTRIINLPDKDTMKKTRNKKIDTREVHYVCSGAFIDDHGTILSAAHCGENADEIEVITSDNQHYKATIINISDHQDLMTLHVDRDNTPYFVLSNSQPKQGEKVYNIGNPLGVTNAYTELVISKLDGDNIFVSGMVLPGQSGSIVFNLEGDMIGVITKVAIVGFGVTTLGIMQSRDSIKFFIDKHK